MSLSDFIQKWPQLPKMKWSDLLKEFNSATKVEDMFEKNFGKRINIVNPDYISTFLNPI
jgi:hypothetical protein